MKLIFYPLLALFALTTISASAQKVNTDSLSIVSKINEYQLKLGKLRNQVAEKTQQKADAAEKAVRSANDNSEAANRLTSDPQDKSLARKADKAASDARSDSKKARIANDRLDELNKEIAKYNDKLTSEQSKLAKYGTATQVMTPTMAPALSDSTKVDSVKTQN